MRHHNLKWVKPPRQARSQQTLERLLDAAEALIADKGIDGVTVAEVARRASSSVGAFYARFDDKEALLRCVLARFYEQAAATTEVALDQQRWLSTPLAGTFKALLHFMLDMLRERRQLIVAMMVRAANDPTLTALTQQLEQQICLGVAGLLARRGDVIDHPQPALARRMCVWMVLSAMETRVLYATVAPAGGAEPGAAPVPGEHGSTPWSDEQLVQQLTVMCLRYLGLEGRDRPGQARPAPAQPSRPAAARSAALAQQP